MYVYIYIYIHTYIHAPLRFALCLFTQDSTDLDVSTSSHMPVLDH